MKEEQDYLKHITEMRSMMERSSKFLSLSGLAGIMAGIYALLGTYIAHQLFRFNPAPISYTNTATTERSTELFNVILLGTAVLVLSITTAVLLSLKNAKKRKETFWNVSTKQLVSYMSVPLLAGGLLILICIAKGLIGFIIPFTLLFYGLALYMAGKFTYKEVKSLGLIQIGLGLISACFEEYALLLWALGFGLLHIIYGIYMHYRYER
ncbi:hypothetical protein [Niabella ginsengisoli]|uniref:Uncharacterized protein n=1 Tax=Niabella ginsengisoli TaxID=522298 RepID=A0ABS9SPC9_9BACT|nr:hypothetical protein [Niabella ginsengisoli]MCH5600212.1 hypothetical protein [Niabella ginsengisoli]